MKGLIAVGFVLGRRLARMWLRSSVSRRETRWRPRFLEAAWVDGDEFSYLFRQLHRNKVVGERTWRSVHGINRSGSLMKVAHRYRPTKTCHKSSVN